MVVKEIIFVLVKTEILDTLVIKLVKVLTEVMDITIDKISDRHLFEVGQRK